MAYELTEEDVQALRWMYSKMRNEQKRPGSLHQEDSLPSAPQVFIGKAPFTGIAAYEEDTGTGTGTTDDIQRPGKAECDVYRILDISTPDVAPYSDIAPFPTALKRPVYNLSNSDILGGSFLLAVRDQFRRYVAVPTALSHGINMQWVRLLCVMKGPTNPGTGLPEYGYPGLVTTYDPDTGTYIDVGNDPAIYSASIPAGDQQTIIPDDMDMKGMNVGDRVIKIDGNCASEAILITGTDKTARGTAVISGGRISSITLDFGGAGYTKSSIPIKITGGDGRGAQAHGVVTGGSVTSVVVDFGGIGFTSPPGPKIEFELSPATPTRFIADFPGDNIACPVISIGVSNGGTGYNGNPPTASLSGGTGSGAEVGGVTLDTTGDSVGSIALTNGGQDYCGGAPTVELTGGGSPGASATAEIGNPIRFYKAGVWVAFNPGEFIPLQNDAVEPVYFLARQEHNTHDGMPLYLALGGLTAGVFCADGSGSSYYAGRLISYTPAAIP